MDLSGVSCAALLLALATIPISEPAHPPSIKEMIEEEKVEEEKIEEKIEEDKIVEKIEEEEIEEGKTEKEKYGPPSCRP